MPLVIRQYDQQIGLDGGGRMPRASVPDLAPGPGAALVHFGDQLGRVEQELTKTRREADLTDRLGRATAELADLELTYEKDTDFKTAGSRFQQAVDEVKSKYIDGADPVVAQAFGKRYSELALAKSLSVRKAAVKREMDYNVASLDTSLDVFATSAAKAKSPEERDLIDNQARVAIASAVASGSITQEDAGKRERRYRSRLDEATVLRDMQENPSITADKLAIDPSYAANVDPVQRERYVSQAYTRAESIRTREEARIAKEHKQRGDELMMDAWSRLEAGKLTRDHIENIRGFLSPGEYHSLLRGVREKKESSAMKNDEAAVAAVYRKLYVENDPDGAEKLAFRYQQNGLMKAATLGAVIGTARSISRQEGPRTEYERSRQYIVQVLDAGALSGDPAPKARMGVALRELDDYVAGGKRTDEEVRKKANEVVSRYQIIDMNDLITKTGLGARNDPQMTLDRITGEASRLQREVEAKRMSKGDFDKRMTNLNAQRKAAEAALQGATSGRK